MSTAVLLYGQARTFKECYPTQRWQIYRKLKDPHFFVSVVDDDQAKDMEILRDHFANVHIERVEQPTLTEYAATGAHAPYLPSVPQQAILRQFWAAQRCFDFATDSADITSFDTFLRVRPDSRITYFNLPKWTARKPGVYAPWWGTYGGINDRMAVIYGQQYADRYFCARLEFDRLLAAGCPMHPESLLSAALEPLANVSRTLDAEFITMRLPGDTRPHAQPVYYAGDIFRYERELQAQFRRDA